LARTRAPIRFHHIARLLPLHLALSIFIVRSAGVQGYSTACSAHTLRVRDFYYFLRFTAHFLYSNVRERQLRFSLAGGKVSSLCAVEVIARKLIMNLKWNPIKWRHSAIKLINAVIVKVAAGSLG
jgi:hypothetical protein